MPSERTPLQLIAGFQRCVNYPKDELGVLALAKGLSRAANITGVSMADIVDSCLQASMYCPTDSELLVVAKNLREDKLRQNPPGSQHATWERIYGPATPDWSNDLIGVMSDAKHPERMNAIHTKAIRDMLHYTEGDGRHHGDQQYWKGKRSSDLRDHRELVEKVRADGGWRTERELQAGEL